MRQVRVFQKKKKKRNCEKGQGERGTFSEPTDVIGKVCSIVKLSKNDKLLTQHSPHRQERAFYTGISIHY